MIYVKEVYADGSTKSVRAIKDDNAILHPDFIVITEEEYNAFIKPSNQPEELIL
jgi:hypothetical protein